MIYKELTELIIGAAFTVHHTLGPGYLEKVYENALIIELRKQGIDVLSQVPIPVHYDGMLVGDFIADLLVDNVIMVELKAIEVLLNRHEAQLVNYLSATGIDVGLLINFGNSVTVRRKSRIYKAA